MMETWAQAWRDQIRVGRKANEVSVGFLADFSAVWDESTKYSLSLEREHAGLRYKDCVGAHIAQAFESSSRIGEELNDNDKQKRSIEGLEHGNRAIRMAIRMHNT